MRTLWGPEWGILSGRPAPRAEGAGPLNAFFGTRIHFSSADAPLVSRTPHGAVLGDDALLSRARFFPAMLFILLSSPAEIHDNCQTLPLPLDPDTSHNSESEQHTLDLAVDTSHTPSHFMSRNSHGILVTYHLSSADHETTLRGLGQMGALPKVTQLIRGTGGAQNPKPDFLSWAPRGPTSSAPSAVSLRPRSSRPSTGPAAKAHPRRLRLWGNSVP